MQLFWVIPPFKLQNNTNGERWDLGYLSAFGWPVLLCLCLEECWHNDEKQKANKQTIIYLCSNLQMNSETSENIDHIVPNEIIINNNR